MYEDLYSIGVEEQESYLEGWDFIQKTKGDFIDCISFYTTEELVEVALLIENALKEDKDVAI